MTRRAPEADRSRRLHRVAAAVVAAMLFALLAVLGPDRFAGEDAAIELERSRRIAHASRGRALAGTPDLARLDERLEAHGVGLGAPVFIRIFKREFELELWLLRDGRFLRFATYPICRWSGTLGPKLREGDRQAPEGFYVFGREGLNPNSRWHRSFNLGFPNAYDQAHGRTGSYLMVHGGCSSVGCYAMTDPVVDEIWRIVTAALARAQRRIHVHVFPFRMTPENLARRGESPWTPFWQDLQAGYEAFEATQLPPAVAVCAGRYRITVARESDAVGEPTATACRPEGRRQAASGVGGI